MTNEITNNGPAITIIKNIINKSKGPFEKLPAQNDVIKSTTCGIRMNYPIYFALKINVYSGTYVWLKHSRMSFRINVNRVNELRKECAMQK